MKELFIPEELKLLLLLLFLLLKSIPQEKSCFRKATVLQSSTAFINIFFSSAIFSVTQVLLAFILWLFSAGASSNKTTGALGFYPLAFFPPGHRVIKARHSRTSHVRKLERLLCRLV